jgi:calmodulin
LCLRSHLNPTALNASALAAMSSPAPVPNVSEATQRQAARNLIEQLVRNTELYGESEAEEARQKAAAAPEYDDDRDDYFAQKPVPEDGNAALVGRVYSGDPDHKDQVVHAFENYGQITEEILNEWKELFSLFDFDNTGFIKTDDLGTVLRGLGKNLTEEVIATYINSYDSNGSGKMDFPTFYKLLIENAPMPGACSEQQVLKDFHVFDMYRDGTIPVVDLVHLLRNMGEPLTRDDVDHLLQEIYIDGDNKVNIKDFVQHMFRTSAPNPAE